MEIDELVYGKQGALKMRNLKDGLQAIEDKHLEYFKERESSLSFEKHDHLHNHYSMTTNSLGVNFGIKPESDIKEEVKVECQQLFNSIFKID